MGRAVRLRERHLSLPANPPQAHVEVHATARPAVAHQAAPYPVPPPLAAACSRIMKKSIGDGMIPKEFGFDRGLDLVKEDRLA